MEPIKKPEDINAGYIRIRQKDPALFVEGSFRTIDISKKDAIKAIIGRLKSNPEGGTVIQSYLFLKEKWSLAEAETWVEEHKGKSIENLVSLYKEIDLTDSTKLIKYYRAKVLSVDEENHSVKAVVSTEDIDRDKEINTIDSWSKRLDNYKNHAVLLSSHSYNSLQNQIGEAKDININKAQKRLEMDFKYYVNEGNKEADWAYNLASKGMAMYSVGYIPHKILEGDAIPESYRDKEPRRIFTDNELLEVSQVVVGSNRGAIQMGIDAPSIEQNQFMFDVIKTFGSGIPDFMEVKKEVKPEPKPEVKPIVTELVKEVIPEDIKIISPIEVKSMKELEFAFEVMKSGRVISEKNRNIIKAVVSEMDKLKSLLAELIELSEPKPEEEDKEFQSEVNNFLAKSKELLKIK